MILSSNPFVPQNKAKAEDRISKKVESKKGNGFLRETTDPD